jgi:hypothetical protein
MAKVFVVVMVVAGLWFLVPRLRRRASTFIAQRAEARQQKWATLDGKASGEYAAVSLVSGAKSCSAAMAMGDSRILAKDAPALPLPDCDVGECACRYQHLNDRRQESRRGEVRREHKILLGALGSERRDDGDRRKGGARK